MNTPIRNARWAVPAAAGLAVAVAGWAAVGGGGEGRAQEAPRIRAAQEPTARSRAARQIVELLRRGVEVDADQLIAELRAPRELAERRLEIAQEMMNFALVKFLEPPSPTAQRGTFHAAIEDYMAWSLRRLEASLDLAGSDDERRRAIAREVAKIRRVEAIYRELGEAEAVGVTRQNMMALEYRRLELETKLALHAAGRGDLRPPLGGDDFPPPDSP